MSASTIGRYETTGILVFQFDLSNELLVQARGPAEWADAQIQTATCALGANDRLAAAMITPATAWRALWRITHTGHAQRRQKGSRQLARTQNRRRRVTTASPPNWWKSDVSGFRCGECQQHNVRVKPVTDESGALRAMFVGTPHAGHAHCPRACMRTRLVRQDLAVANHVLESLPLPIDCMHPLTKGHASATQSIQCAVARQADNRFRAGSHSRKAGLTGAPR